VHVAEYNLEGQLIMWIDSFHFTSAFIATSLGIGISRLPSLVSGCDSTCGHLSDDTLCYFCMLTTHCPRPVRKQFSPNQWW